MEPVVRLAVLSSLGITLFFVVIALLRRHFYKKSNPEVADWQLRNLRSSVLWYIGFAVGLMQTLRAADMLLMNGTVESTGWRVGFDWAMIAINALLLVGGGVMLASNLFDASCRFLPGMRTMMIRDKN